MKVWDKREFGDLDDDVELGTRNIKVACQPSLSPGIDSIVSNYCTILIYKF